VARLDVLPSEAIIDGLKGILDYYVHKGIPCVRSWPRSPGHRRAPAVEAQWAAFSWAAANWNSLTPEVQAAYTQTAQGSSLTGRDLFMKSFISDYFRDGQWD